MVKVVFEEDGWAGILIKGRVCFVSADYLTSKQAAESLTSQTTKAMYVTATSLKVRQAASTRSAIIGSLKLNDHVSMISTSNGWAKIHFNGKIAFVSETYLTNKKPSKTINDELNQTGTYVIKSSDTFTKIGKTLGFSVSQIQELNPGVEPTKLKIGQIIKIPSTTAPTVNQMPNHTGTYVIKSSDTFTKIGKTLGFSVSQIQELNPGVEPTKLKVGQIIKIPSTTAPTVNQIIIRAQIGGVDDNGNVSVYHV